MTRRGRRVAIFLGAYIAAVALFLFSLFALGSSVGDLAFQAVTAAISVGMSIWGGPKFVAWLGGMEKRERP
jgi:hypothetical protein